MKKPLINIVSLKLIKKGTGEGLGGEQGNAMEHYQAGGKKPCISLPTFVFQKHLIKDTVTQYPVLLYMTKQ